jgi:tripartite-type tricarboxylate transporter receptor subunit TctC
MDRLTTALVETFVVAGAGVAGFGVASVRAQDYPVKPVRIVAESPGSSSDTLARYIGQRLGAQWNQPVVIDNRGPGAAAPRVAEALPSGYTLWMGSTPSLAGAVSMYKKLAYDPVRDFAPITLVSKAPFVFVAHPSVPASNLREFIAYAKKRAGVVAYSSGGVGTAGYLTTGLFLSLTGISMQHLPQRGVSNSVPALVAGEAAVASYSASSVVPHVKSGKLRAYAVTNDRRFAPLPDVPAAAEAGLPGFEASAWYGMLAPAGTSALLISKLNREIVEILRAPETASAFLAQGAEAAPGSPQAFREWIQSEIPKWAKVIKASGIQPK